MGRMYHHSLQGQNPLMLFIISFIKIWVSHFAPLMTLATFCECSSVFTHSLNIGTCSSLYPQHTFLFSSDFLNGERVPQGGYQNGKGKEKKKCNLKILFSIVIQFYSCSLTDKS